MVYYFNKISATSFDDAVGRATAAIQNEGFEVITEIDVQKTLKEKIGVNFASIVSSAPGIPNWPSKLCSWKAKPDPCSLAT